MYSALLGVQPQSDAPYYVGFEAEGQQIGLVPNGGPQSHEVTRGVLVRRGHRSEVDRGNRRRCDACGLAAHNVGGSRLVATVTDPDGNVLGLIQD